MNALVVKYRFNMPGLFFNHEMHEKLVEARGAKTFVSFVSFAVNHLIKRHDNARCATIQSAASRRSRATKSGLHRARISLP